MAEERIAIVDLADELQIRKQRIFKIIRRLGIRPTQRRESTRGNQNVATINRVEAAAIRDELTRADAHDDRKDIGLEPESAPTSYLSDELGIFYLIRLEPDHDPKRFKVGFTTDLAGRLRKHRCSAPFAQCVKTWPCRRTWERAAIDW